MKIDTSKSELQNLRDLVINTYPNMSEDYRDYIEFRNLTPISIGTWDIETKRKYLFNMDWENINNLEINAYNTAIDIYIENKKYATLKYRRVNLGIINKLFPIRPYNGVIHDSNDRDKVIQHIKSHIDIHENSIDGYFVNGEDTVIVNMNNNNLLYVGSLTFPFLRNYPVEYMGKLGWGKQ